MKAAVLYGAHDIRVDDVPDAKVADPTDAVVRIVRSCVCGSDLWRYRGIAEGPTPSPIGHEFIGVVEDIGDDVRTVNRGDFVIAPFKYSDGVCEFCVEGLPTSCIQGGLWGTPTDDGGQAEAARIPFADGTLVTVPQLQGTDGKAEENLLLGLLGLSDVVSTGHHAAVSAEVGPGDDIVIIGDGAVALSAVLASQRLGAERIVLLGRHKGRTDLGRIFGATHVVSERGEAAIAGVRSILPAGVPKMIEAVGTVGAWETAIGAVRDGGVISYVGVPHAVEGGVPLLGMFRRNIKIAGGIAPARAYIPELLTDVLSGALDPAPLFDKTFGLEEVAHGYRMMDNRSVLKAVLTI
ncbi:alcohol dehydrogenase catalytic domain-containing protein [Nesterenkonia muleiensis]|uniref:alcohol dehydrogenase catalytic domain-containing protein n=1 Tax=Nesterenkonia muleiensis TaxID=2282648 RepID=UPI000E76C4FC|nr:alcohol dehydrogenase catalytic domain-containing protein [Nesterenkonia muleiensis]